MIRFKFKTQSLSTLQPYRFETAQLTTLELCRIQNVFAYYERQLSWNAAGPRAAPLLQVRFMRLEAFPSGVNVKGRLRQ